MRNKIFIGIFCGFILFVMLGAPAKMLLTRTGMIRSDNVGNVITVDKVYNEGTFCAPFFNAIEEVKRDINDIYTNYIPFYVDITSAASRLRLTVNQPVTSFLLNKGNEILLAQMDTKKQTEASPAEMSPADTPSADTEMPADTVVPDETDVPDTVETETEAPEPEAEKAFEPTARAIYLKGDARHRYYEIIAQTEEDGPRMDFYVRVPAEDASSLQDDMERQTDTINDFASRLPEVNWYVFPVTCFEDTVLCDQVLPAESKHGLFEAFFTRLDEGIQYDYLDIRTFEDKYNLYFRSDHHWNAYGQAEAYSRIAAMFRENYPELEILEPEIHTFDNKVQMYGSNALAVSSYTISDYFHAADFSLPAHTAVQDTNVPYGGTRTIEESFDIYLNKRYSTERGYNHYMHFYRILKEVQYPENRTGRNLLIIGDSYSPPLLEVLASHFDTTIIRYVDSNSGLPNMKYEDLIAEHSITDVLFLQISDRVIYDYYGDSLINIY